MKITAKNVTDTLHRFNEIYGDPEMPMPENTPIIVYCSNDKNTSGWCEVNELGELGLEALIAKKWISKKSFLEW